MKKLNLITFFTPYQRMNGHTVCTQRFQQFVAKCTHVAKREWDDSGTFHRAVTARDKASLLDKLYVLHEWHVTPDGECRFGYRFGSERHRLHRLVDNACDFIREDAYGQMILSADGDKLWTNNGRDQYRVQPDDTRN